MLLRNLVRAQLFSTPAGQPIDIHNSLFCAILRANPSLAIFYADFLRHLAANPNLLIDLQIQSGIFFNPDQAQKTAPHQACGQKKRKA